MSSIQLGGCLVVGSLGAAAAQASGMRAVYGAAIGVLIGGYFAKGMMKKVSTPANARNWALAGGAAAGYVIADGQDPLFGAVAGAVAVYALHMYQESQSS